MKFILFVVNLVIISTQARNHVRFYDRPFFQGSSTTLALDGTTCVNLDRFKDRASSVDVVGNARCGYIYELENCQGKKVRVERFSWRSIDFGNSRLNKDVKSYRNCNPDGAQRIYINDKFDYQGQTWYLDLPTDGSCVTLAPPHDTITSSVVLYDYCIIAWEKQFCNGKPLRLDATTIGIRDLSVYKVDKDVKSFQLCYGVDVKNWDVEHTK